MSDHIEQRRREALAERNEERQIFHAMLSEPGGGGLSKERAAALQITFKRRAPSNMPKSERGLVKEERARLEGLAEMAMARCKNSVIEVVEEQEEVEEEDEEKDEEGPQCDGDTVSYSLNGKPCTKEELDKGDISRRIIEDKSEERLAQSTPAFEISSLAQIQKQRAEEERIDNLYDEEWGHCRSFEVREQKEGARMDPEEKNVVEGNVVEGNVVEDNAEQKMNVQDKSDEVA